MNSKLLSVAMLLIVASTTQARAIRIDQGNNWGESLVANIASDGNQTVSLGFDINFGAGLVNSLTIAENGFVTFADSSNITALAVDFDSDPLATSVEDEGAVTYTQGIFDLGATFNPGDTPDAFRVQWIHQSNFHVMQILVLDMGGGDFDLEINHGCDDRPLCDDVTPVGVGAMAGFSLGTNNIALTGPFGLGDNLTYQFRDGELVRNDVPAPAPLALSLIGLLALSLRRRR